MLCTSSTMNMPSIAVTRRERAGSTALGKMYLSNHGSMRVRVVLLGPAHLLLRHRDAGDRDAVALGGKRREAAPAAAQVEHAHAGLQPDLAAHQIELGVLRLVERLGVLPVRAGVEQAAAEHRLVEIVADVVAVSYTHLTLP